MHKIHIQVKRVVHRLAKTRDGSGFSMLEAVVTVGVLLALAAGGFFAYGPIVKNAKLAKVRSAVSEVYTAVTVAQIDGDPTTSPRSVVDTYNGSSDSIKFRIRQGFPEPVVAAMSTEEEDYIPKSDNDFCLVATLIKDETISAEQGSCKVPELTPEEPQSTATPTPTPTPTPPPYVDPTPTLTKLTYKCDTTVSGYITMSNPKGTETWSDGTTYVDTGYTTSNNRKTLTAGVTYNLVFDGTYSGLNQTYFSKCLRSVDHLGSNSGMTTTQNAFFGAINLTSVPAHIPATITNMQGMFNGATSFNDSNVKNWDVSNVTNMVGMFEGASSFNQPLNSWNVAKVTNMFSMFKDATNFNQPLRSWNTSAVANTSFMFNGANAFDQDLATWNTDSVKVMAYMFDLPDKMRHNVRHTTADITTTFTYKCDAGMNTYALMSNPKGTETWSDETVLVDSGYTTANYRKVLSPGITYTLVFEGTYSGLNQTHLNKCLRSVDRWGSNTGMTTTQNAFFGAINLISVPAQLPATVTNMQGMFNGATNFNDANVSQWNVSNITNMVSMFEGASSFNQPLNSWDVTKVTNMFSMFKNASNFNKALNSWNIGAVSNTSFMFNGANAFNQDLASWNTNSVKVMAYMFDLPDKMRHNVRHNTENITTTVTYKCDAGMNTYALMSNPKGTETWSDGTILVDTGYTTANYRMTLNAGVTYTLVFEGTYSGLNQTHLNKCLRSVDRWGSNTGMTTTQNAFSGAVNLTNVPDNIPNSVTNMQGMFNGATNFNDADVKSWDVSRVVSMSTMFNGASNFNQNLSNWNVSKVTAKTDFNTGSALTLENLPKFK